MKVYICILVARRGSSHFPLSRLSLLLSILYTAGHVRTVQIQHCSDGKKEQAMFEFSLMQSTSYVVWEVNCPNSFNLDPLNKGSERNVPAGDGTDTATRSACFTTTRTQSNRKVAKFQNFSDSDSKHAR